MINQESQSFVPEAAPGLQHTIVDDRKDLKNIRDLFWQLLKNYPDGSISIIDTDFHFIYTGGEIYRQLGTDPDDWIGKKIFPLFPLALQNKIKSVLTKVLSGQSISDFELLDCCFDGSSYALDAFPLVEEDNTIKRAGLIIRNVSNLKKAEESLKKALEKERELSELKSRFLSMASHEFRTPLSTILSSSYLLMKYVKTEEQTKRERHLERIISSVNMLTDILNDFLSIGKIEEGKISVRPEEINIPEFTESIVCEIHQILKKEQELLYDHSGIAVVTLDKGLLKHIVLNLLSNAIKFSDEGTVIKIQTVNQSGSLILSIKDNGIGISKEDQKHLFERFFRGENVSHIEGTGLGLHIVSRYAELMNGKIKCNSELGKGTEFIVTFK
jgi:PAS domain S-box-containing protein